MNANKMTAIDLAEFLADYDVIKEGPFSQIIGTKAAAMLRKQHAAIKVLREALRHMITVCPAIDQNGEDAHDHAFNAMAETEESHEVRND